MKNLFIAASALLLCLTPRAGGFEPVAVRDGLPNASAKLKAGSDLTVVYLGGSITKGGRNHGFSQAVPA